MVFVYLSADGSAPVVSARRRPSLESSCAWGEVPDSAVREFAEALEARVGFFVTNRVHRDDLVHAVSGREYLPTVRELAKARRMAGRLSDEFMRSVAQRLNDSEMNAGDWGARVGEAYRTVRGFARFKK